MKNWTANDIPDQSGKVVIVTGANSGLGYQSSLALARKGALVVMAGRDPEKGQRALQVIQSHMPKAKLEFMRLDLASLASIKDFAGEFKARFDRLDILMNNAGVMAIPQGTTEDGFERQFGTNHLGHFALTGRLLDRLVQAPGSRVVTVSSMAYLSGRINFEDLQLRRKYSRFGAYGQSKLANVLFALELQRRLKAAGSATLSLVAHPGFSATNLQHNSAQSSRSQVEGILYNFTNRFVAQSAAMGALPQLFAATAPEADAGKLYGPRYFSRGYPEPGKVNATASNPQTARRLWEVSEELTGVKYSFGTAPTESGAAAAE